MASTTTCEKPLEDTPKRNIDRLCANEQAVKTAGEQRRELSDGRAPVDVR